MSNYPVVTEVFPGARLQEVVTSAQYGHSAFNSSIGWHPKKGYGLIVRDSNYVMSPNNLEYWMTSSDQSIQTISHLCLLDDDLNIIDMRAIRDSAVRDVKYEWVQGMEDSRLIPVGDNWHRYGTLREHRPDGACEIAEDRLDGEAKVVERFVYPNPEPGRAQKNWTRMVGTNHWIYLCGPSSVLRNGSDLVYDQRQRTPYAGEFRGGSPAIPFQGGFVSIVHLVTWDPRPREYWHTLCLFDADGFLEAYTPAFYFKSPGIEFSAGLVVHGDDLVASFGYAESRCFFAHIPIQDVERRWQSAFV
jgi:predicted GH43/DUF377 family glycosyl hydrolase